MAQLKGKHLRASTLLEVIVAMVVILAVFTLAIGIYTNVTRSSPSFRQQYLRKISEDVIKESINSKNWKDEELVVDSVILKKQIKALDGYTDLVVIEVSASEYGKEACKIKRIVKKDQDAVE
ncbi:hypothetical protein DBR11_07495 [Pedobacter sp. HMWF019]|uniref:PulJ/GspJ family protein n=1 Tax=Pedobacter sp. HMWF019 TaxID=2056856 RepID=UPI000D34D1CB|nr:hypothetical protein [Pedobacter sp. HMWF019]PTT01385.1 hypothetical protein DBR11_07495 [Pedobacter sp. HMWF019]